MKSQLVVAFAGNPNSGKTTIFNNLTGARQHVGNYPGVTVERKEGKCRHNGVDITIVDLPGTYSLSASSAEEKIAHEFVTTKNPDLVVDIIDASNLERNLYLAVQLMELGVPLLLVFNMADMVEARGYQMDIEKLSQLFGAKIVETIGHKGEGMDELLDAIIQTAGVPAGESRQINYGRDLEAEISAIARECEKLGKVAAGDESRRLAIRLLEGDSEKLEALRSPEIVQQLESSTLRIEELVGDQPQTAIASGRYGFISGACQESVRSTIEIRHSISDRLDAIITNRVLGIPIFLALMYLVFKLTFTIGGPPMGWIDGFFGSAGDLIASWWPDGSDSLLKSLLVDGIIGGVGGVLIFLPNILLLFLAIAILEDSGYMARAAFIMDRLMHKIGLHGKSFIPMLIGFGCSVPAIMATRTLDNRRDRLVTMLVAPLMSCGARLPIYALLIPAFFPEAWHTRMLFIIYVIGIVLAIVVAKLLRSTLFKGESAPFVMELPPYRVPTVKGVLMHMWQRGWLYVRKAGTLILAVSILMWAMATFPGVPAEQAASFAAQRTAVENSDVSDEVKEERIAQIDNQEAEVGLRNSYSGRIGRAIEPLLKPMGFDWKIGTAMIGSFAAKEVFVSQMGIVYSVGEADEESVPLRETLRATYSPLVAFCIMLYGLISAPCMATIAVTKRESASWAIALGQLVGLTVLAYVLTVMVYQIGSAAGIGLS